MKFNKFLINWPLRLAIIIGGLGVIAFYSYHSIDGSKFKPITISRAKNQMPLSVSQANLETLNPNILTSNSVPSSTSQTELSNSSQGSSASLQSNLNTTDPSVSSNPLVQSLYSSGQ